MSDQYKKIVYYDTPKKHADLKIRWQHDSIKQSEFFRLLTSFYLDRDERILEIVHQYQEEKSIQNKSKRKKTKEIQVKGRAIGEKFALRDNEVQNIFDLLEKEHPDL